MAFRAPTHHAPQRLYTSTSQDVFAEASPSSQQRLDDSQEWILFSPAQDSVGGTGTLLSHNTSTGKTGQTAGRSRLSDYGSLGTEVEVWEAGTNDLHTPTVQEESDEELDSLDSHLLEFRSQESSGRYHQHHEEREVAHGLLSAHLSPEMEVLEAASQSILPAHDGLGSFQLSPRASSDPLCPAPPGGSLHQPRPIKRRQPRESLDFILARESTERLAEESREAEKRIRIEEWRMEQSRAIMEEVQKESRRQRQRLAGKRTNSLREYCEGEMASMGGIAEAGGWVAAQSRESLHVECPVAGEEGEEGERDEGFWARITRRLVMDLMGIDDKLLSILFGESLPEDFEEMGQGTTNPLDGHTNDSGWENRLLERIARELGLLVNQISDHPGAFNTYLHVSQASLPYAGLPIIPEAQPEVKDESILSPASPMDTSATQQSNIFFPTIATASKAEPPLYDPISSSRHYFDSEMDYIPTASRPAAPAPTQNLLNSQATSGYHHPSYSVHTVASNIEPSPTPRAMSSTSTGFTKEEWEKQLDIGLVFKYLRSRFSVRKTTTPTFARHHSSPADQAARAARVRQHHPLVAGRPVVERRGSYKVAIPTATGASGMGQGLLRRRSSSCASQSTKASASLRSRRLSGSSRAYWDIGCGGSLGSGSIIVSTGGMGGWGDV